jgi:hypothetical protein
MCEQGHAPNHHAFGTFVTDPADAGSAPKAGGDRSSRTLDQHMVLRASLFFVVCAIFCSCAHYSDPWGDVVYLGLPISALKPEDDIFKKAQIPIPEAVQIIERLQKAPEPPQFIYSISRLDQKTIEVRSLDQPRMEFGSGEGFIFHKTARGWISDRKAARIYWSRA